MRYAGVSNFHVKHLERAQQKRAIASLQPPYSMLQREVEKEVLGYCAKHTIGVVAYSPMASGLLTGRFDRKKLAAGDWRNAAEDFNEPRLGREPEARRRAGSDRRAQRQGPYRNWPLHGS